jgi:glycosyltransferase involved in cell wall biosynthesis
MNVLFLTKYGRLAASTRYRYSQFQPGLLSAGIKSDVSPLLDDDYLSAMFAGRRPKLAMAKALLRRAHAVLTARRYDCVILHCEAYPYLPPVFEWWLQSRGIPYVYDFDDAIFHQYDIHPNPIIRRLFSNKIRRVIRGASAVIAGNEYLADYARQVNPHVTVIPTVVDTDRYLARPRSADAPGCPLVVGWIGSPSTAKYVVERAAALRTFCVKHGARVVLVGSGPVELPGVPLELRPWAEASEVTDIQQFDIGIMPLSDTPWARGKCGFKLIQYMACGIPVVASPVGVNASIVAHGSNGFLASTDAEWVAALEEIATNAERRARMGTAALESVARSYSLAAATPKLLTVLSDLKNRPNTPDR